VIVYSAQPQKLSSVEYLDLADAVLDKGTSYVDFKERVDALLQRRATPGYFISALNRELGDSAALAPKSVSKALGALRSGDASGLREYLRSNLPDAHQVDRALMIITIGIETLKFFKGG
jgi:hypothetical protein